MKRICIYSILFLITSMSFSNNEENKKTLQNNSFTAILYPTIAKNVTYCSIASIVSSIVSITVVIIYLKCFDTFIPSIIDKSLKASVPTIVKTEKERIYKEIENGRLAKSFFTGLFHTIKKTASNVFCDTCSNNGYHNRFR